MDSSDYANLPAGNPPPGILANFDHPVSRAVDAHVGMGISMGIALVFMALRLYVKSTVVRIWGWDDLSCLMGFALIVGHDIIAFTMMTPGKGLGTHIWDIKVISFTKAYLQKSLATILLYAASAFFVKLSLFLLYLRLFKLNRITTWLIYAGILVCGLFYSASIIFNSVNCMPRPGEPDDSMTWLLRARKCDMPSRQLAVVQGAFGTVSDIYLLVIPIHSVFQLHLPTARKVGVNSIFMIGIIAVVCSLGSLAYRSQGLSETDLTWHSVSIYIFCSAEISAGITCSCMPLLASLFRGPAPKRFCFPTLRFPSLHFSSHRFAARNSRKPFISNKYVSSDDLHTTKRQYSSERETSNNDMELESGIVYPISNNVV